MRLPQKTTQRKKSVLVRPKCTSRRRLVRLWFILFCSFLVGCSQNYNQHAAVHANRNFAGRFHGEYFLAFSRKGILQNEGHPTWYNKPPRSGPRTPFARIPPTRVQPGMTASQVRGILGEPDGLFLPTDASANRIRRHMDVATSASWWWKYDVR